MDIERARFNMIESQIRTWEVLDQRVLDLLSTVKREQFVPEKYRPLAFVDMEIPLGHGEVMLAPKLEARMLQELTLRPGDRVLEVGTGQTDFLVAAIDNDGDRAIHVGPTFSYYEFTVPTKDRMTDEQWTERVAREPVERPRWIAPWIAR